MGRKARGAAKEKREPAHKIDGDGMELTAEDGQTTGGTLPSTTAAIVVDAEGQSAPEAPVASAEYDAKGRPYLESEKWQKMGGTGDDTPGVFARIFSGLYGDLPMSDRLRVAWLAGTLFFIIGGYWLLRSLKDPIVATIVGVDFIPRCKMLSLVVVFSLVFVYNKLVDIFPKHQLFYIIGAFYFATFSAIAIALADPVIGVQNKNASPTRLIGWISYCAIESFGSICVSLFWAFVNSSVNVETAKSAFGLIIAGANLGSIMGPTLAVTKADWGLPRLYGCGALCMGLMVLMVWGYVRKFGVEPSLMKANSKKKGAGVLEGFQLFLKYDYIKGIFAMSCLFMVEVTILDYTMKKLANDEFAALHPGDQDSATRAFVAFTGMFGQVTNTISFGFSLLGTSMVIRRLGLKTTLLAFPCMCLAVVIMVMAFPQLYVVFLALILLKGFSYSLNNPCKEILYQPTNSAVKFKSKSWIDIFGARMSKAGGSLVTDAFSSSIPGLIHVGGSVAAGGAAFLIWVAWVMGRKFDHLMETGEVIGGDGESTEPTLEALAASEEAADAQEAADTSCGVLEEGQADEAFLGEEGGAAGERSESKNSVDL
ncbi:conserved unknown protein [Ectocarpus siliculosus]|uniref:ADP,ATP carrier protein n=1 Tax=Ectocarpus siliculosus TaxID=2880 RepID=D7FJI3_ECTSI|nr:conserved unknown protein [Ectocarpus siliculosus]|eukprot:CBJ29086.1 conserved unknown protein [Ectocarpus siliculosus]